MLTKSKRNNTKYIVESGNWIAEVKIEKSISDYVDYEYVEAATRAMECVFHVKHDIKDDFDMISLLNKEGKNYFSEEHKGALSDVPDASFGLLTLVYKEIDSNDNDKHMYYLSGDVFANAGMNENVKLARAVEEKYPDDIAAFKEKRRSVANNPHIQSRKIVRKKKPDEDKS